MVWMLCERLNLDQQEQWISKYIYTKKIIDTYSHTIQLIKYDHHHTHSLTHNHQLRILTLCPASLVDMYIIRPTKQVTIADCGELE